MVLLSPCAKEIIIAIWAWHQAKPNELALWFGIGLNFERKTKCLILIKMCLSQKFESIILIFTFSELRKSTMIPSYSSTVQRSGKQQSVLMYIFKFLQIEAKMYETWRDPKSSTCPINVMMNLVYVSRRRYREMGELWFTAAKSKVCMYLIFGQLFATQKQRIQDPRNFILCIYIKEIIIISIV